MKLRLLGMCGIYLAQSVCALTPACAADGTPVIVPPASPPAAVSFPPSDGAFDVVYRQVDTSAKRGTSKTIEYRLTLRPDPARRNFYIGTGVYEGRLTFRRLNCLQGPDNAHTIDVKGKIEATGYLRSAGIPNPQLSLTLKTLDWPIKFPAMEGAELAQTPVEKAASAGLGSVTVLPGVELLQEVTQEDRETRSPGGDCDGEFLSQARIAVRKNQPPKDLKAVITASAGAKRGDTLTLDGSGSLPAGKIESYHWKISPGSDCPSGVQAFERDTKSLSFRSLCSMQAELTVKAAGSNQTDTAMQQVTVAARAWNVTLSRNDTPGQLNSHFRMDRFPRLGLNLCSHEALATAQESGHFIHKEKGSATWNGVGYQVDTIHEPGGPFDGWSYVKSQNLQIDRSVLISGELMEGSEVYRLNRIACQGAKPDKCMLDLVIAATVAHEEAHTDLLHEAAKTDDGNGAKRIEKLTAPPSEGKAGLIKKADSELSQVETVLLQATDDKLVVPRVKAKVPAADRSGYLLVPDVDGGGYSAYPFANIAENGE